MLCKFVSWGVLTPFLFLFVKSENQGVCTRRALTIGTHRQPYKYTYIEQYKTRCWYGGTCTKTRRQLGTDYRILTRREWKTLEFCCDGYIRDDSSPDDAIVCKPICMPSCTNGYCQNLGECVCNEGYSVDPYNTHNCLPFCNQTCEHGSCVAPNTCECDFGYALNGTCQPICTTPCENGKCTAPDTCECHDGYRKSDNDTCEPYCSIGCEHGTCLEPETCICNDGFTMEDQQCIPHCENGCGNGTCIATNTCECDPGYNIENGTCEPICPDPCTHGSCIAPFTCTCDDGYIFKWGNCYPDCDESCGIHGMCVAPGTCTCEPGYRNTNTCLPNCCEAVCSKPCIHGTCIEPEFCECDSGYKKDPYLDECLPDCFADCGNGTCVAPNVCECHPGFEEREDRQIYEVPVCEPICRNCEGECTEPYICNCNEGFETIHESVNGAQCDCFVNCSGTSIQCDRTVCVASSTVEISTESTTIVEEQESYVHDGLTDEVNEKLNIYRYDIDMTESEYFMTKTTYEFTESGNTVYNSTASVKNIVTAKQSNDKLESSSAAWIYAIIALLLVLIVVAVFLVVIKRKAVAKFFTRGSYSIEDDVSDSSQPHDVRLSTIQKNRRDSCS